MPGGLRVVEEDDVPGPDALRELGGARGERLLVDLALGVAEVAAVAGGAVEVVVDPLGDREELAGCPSITPQRASTPAPRA